MSDKKMVALCGRDYVHAWHTFTPDRAHTMECDGRLDQEVDAEPVCKHCCPVHCP